MKRLLAAVFLAALTIAPMPAPAFAQTVPPVPVTATPPIKYTMEIRRADGTWRQSEFLGEYAKKAMEAMYPLACKDTMNAIVTVYSHQGYGATIHAQFVRAPA